jgi:malate/lactate dehydrogenase
MEREDLLQDNARIFPEQGRALDEVAARDVQMRVVGNPANTNALIAMNTAKSLPRTSFTSMSLEIDAFSQERIALRANGSLTPRITR